MAMTRRGFLGGAAAVGAGAVLLPGGGTALAGETKSTAVHDIAGHLVKVCAPQIRALRKHPWILGAAHDRLTPAQIGSWATQDLLWFPRIAPAYTTGFAGAPAKALAAQAYLNGNDANETAYLTRTSRDFRNAPGADQIWPGYLGYGDWGGLIGVMEAPLPPPHVKSLTVVWGAELAYHLVWEVPLAAHPQQAWARFGANNWGGSGFGNGVVANLNAGLNAAYTAAPVPLPEIEEIARQVFRWEFRAWTDSWECKGWSL